MSGTVRVAKLTTALAYDWVSSDRCIYVGNTVL